MPTPQGIKINAATRKFLAACIADAGGQSAVAKRMKVSHVAISNILSGDRRPSEAMLRKLCATLGRTVVIVPATVEVT